MRTENVIDSLIWFINVLLAFAIILFAFLFILFPKPESLATRYQSELDIEEADDRPPDYRTTLDQYRPCWKRLSEPAAPVSSKGPAVDLNKIYKVTATHIDPLDAAKWQVYLFNKVTQVESAFSEGGSLEAGYRIVEIGRGYMMAERADPSGKNERQRLELFIGDEREEGATGNPTGDAGSRLPAANDLESILARGRTDPNDPNRWRVTADEREYVLAHQEDLMNEVQMRPYVPPGGQMQGVMLEDFPAHSIAARRGFQKGDVITAVNGVTLNSSEAANSLMSNDTVRNATTVMIVVQRQGRTITMQFDVQGAR